MINAIAGVLALLVNPISDWLKRNQELAKAKHETQLEIEKNKARLAADREQYNHEWEMESLKRSPGLLKIFSFCGWYFPMIATVFFPDYGSQIFANMKNAPEWYVQGFIVINFAVWGISVSRDTITQIVHTVSMAWKKYRVNKEIDEALKKLNDRDSDN